MDDSFLEAINAAIKEEIVENYFFERRIIEEEVAEVDRLRTDFDEAQASVFLSLSYLAALLLDEERLTRLGADLFPDRQLPEIEPGLKVWTRPTTGFTWRGRFKNLVGLVTEELFKSLTSTVELREQLIDLVDEVNEDIDKFHTNFDFMMIRSVVCQLDPATLEKKFFLGSALEGEACLDLDTAMRFKKLKPPEPDKCLGLVAPGKSKLERLTMKAAREVLKASGPEVRSALEKGRG